MPSKIKLLGNNILQVDKNRYKYYCDICYGFSDIPYRSLQFTLKLNFKLINKSLICEYIQN